MLFILSHALFQLDNASAGARNVLTELGLQLLPSWPSAKVVHLEDRHPRLLDERVYLLGIGSVRAILTLHHHDFSLSTPLHQLHAAL